jgi:lysophospholipase L1-like esterase
MSDPFSLAATAIAQQTAATRTIQPLPLVERQQQIQAEKERLDRILRQLRQNTRPERSQAAEFGNTEFRPQTGSQLFHQRTAALVNRQIYTRLPASSFQTNWNTATQPPTYQQWRSLLAQEAQQITATSQPVGIVLGDSLSQWFPSDRLPPSRVWLNQSISGDTTSGILKRLSTFAHIRPQVVYLMAGVNDLKNGASDQTIVRNLSHIIQRLRQTHPQTQIVLQSILPTRSLPISSQRIINLNRQLHAIARQQGAYYLDVHAVMADREGYLRPDLTTDGLHLNDQGYATWQAVLQHADTTLAQR